MVLVSGRKPVKRLDLIEEKKMNAVALGIATRIIRETYPAAIVTAIGSFKFTGTDFNGKVRVTGYQMNPAVYTVTAKGSAVSLKAVR
jgi:hypothetical protein